MKVKNNDHPVIRELNQRVENCKATLLNLLNEWHFLREDIAGSISFSYDTIFGNLENELQNKSGKADDLENRVRILAVKLKKGEKITGKTIRSINAYVDKKSKKHKKQNVLSNFEKNENKNAIERNPVNADYEIPYLYRSLVKIMHPDTNGDNEYFRNFWLNVQNAYKSEDLDRLRLFYESLCKTRDNSFKSIKAEEISLRTEIKQFEFNIDKQKEKIEKLKKNEPFIFEDKLNDKRWISRRKRVLNDRIYRMERRINYNVKLLRNLTNDKVQIGENNRLEMALPGK